ncbi:MAG: immunoglobulin domain-containing protein, partial [Verrucomicrobiota bacterium]
MKKCLLGAFTVLSLSLGASADTLAVWDFNSNPPDGLLTTGTLIATNGASTASLVGIAGVPLFNDAQQGTQGISSDPATSDDSAWRLTNSPPQGMSNLTAGVEFRVNTTGFENITLKWDQSSAGASSKYYRVLYSTNNGVTFVPKDVVTNPTNNASWSNPVTNISFISIPAANNNTNFIVRILSEWQSTATGSGSDVYATVSGVAYSTAAAFRLDMVTFSGSVGNGNVSILTNPAPSQVVAIGQPASFSVVAGGGSTAIGYQWRTNGTAIPGATSSTYSIASAQLSNAGNYTVVVTNAVNSVTSSVAVLTVRTPLNLAWTGLSGATWDSSTVSWVNTNTLADVAYTGGDHVAFGSQGISSPTVVLAETLLPSSVTVDADFDYLLRTDTDGKLSGSTGIRKRGTGTLQIDTDNTHTGATVIETGTLQVGVANARGSLGTGPVTNNSALVFNRSDTFIMGNNISGSGTITNIGKTITLTGTNVYNGEISVLSGALILSGSQTINSSDVRVTAQLSGVSAPTIFGISGGIITSPTTVLTTYGSSLLGDFRTTLKSTSGTNVWNGPIFLSGLTNNGGNNQFQVDNVGTDLTINGDVTGIDGFGGTGAVTLRGIGTGTMVGKITIPGVVNKTDAGTWTIKSTGNSWGGTTIGVGTLKLGINDALPTNIALLIGQSGTALAALDLAGFNQQLAVFQDNAGGGG